MSDRLISVTAHTTLEYVEATATGQDFEWESVAVVNAMTDTDEPTAVRLQFELDNLAEDHLPKHLTECELTPEQARTLAADLEAHADRVESAATGGDDGGSEA